MRNLRYVSWMLVLALLVTPAAILAQEQEQEMEGGEQAVEEQAQRSLYSDPDEGWKDRRFHVGGWWGEVRGGTSLGLVENVFFRSTFNTGKDTGFGFRAGWVFAPRFDVELEYGNSSPGLIATLTDLQGGGKTDVDFSPLDMTWVMGVVNYSMIERTRRVVPYLTLGLGVVSVSLDDRFDKSRKPGLIFGAGVRVRIVDFLALRADARGLRSGFGTKQEEEDLPGVFVGDFNASNFIWTVGVDVRF